MSEAKTPGQERFSSPVGNLVSQKAVGIFFVSVYRRLLSVCSCGGGELLYGSYAFSSLANMK